MLHAGRLFGKEAMGRCRVWPSAAVLAAAGAATTAAAAEITRFKLTGACDAHDHVNGHVFERMGHTLRGSPYYKATNSDIWIYHDMDCGDSKDGTPRWILDNDHARGPDLTATHDLDHDKHCHYLGRVDSNHERHPPLDAKWIMWCDGMESPKVIHITPLLGGPAYSPEDSSGHHDVDGDRDVDHGVDHEDESPGAGHGHEDPAPGATHGNDQDGHSSSTEGTQSRPVPEAGHEANLTADGFCSELYELNGAVFHYSGQLRDGSPWYTVEVPSQTLYLFFDADCDGPNARNVHSIWAIDADKPLQDRNFDIDGDGECDYFARADTFGHFGKRRPPLTASWSTWCGAKLGFTQLSISMLAEGEVAPSGVPAQAQHKDRNDASAAPGASAAAALALFLFASLACAP